MKCPKCDTVVAARACTLCVVGSLVSLALLVSTLLFCYLPGGPVQRESHPVQHNSFVMTGCGPGLCMAVVARHEWLLMGAFDARDVTTVDSVRDNRFPCFADKLPGNPAGCGFIILNHATHPKNGS